MAEYIDRKAVLDSSDWFEISFDAGDEISFEYIPVDKVKAIPAADVAPVRHGYWVWDEDGMDWGIGSWRCSECHTRPETWWQGNKSSPYNKSGHYYCPNCGAKMDKELC